MYSDETHGIHSGKYLWKHHFRDSKFQNDLSLDASALRNLCLWCEFQSRLLIIISLLLKNFLTALEVVQIVSCPFVLS